MLATTKQVTRFDAQVWQTPDFDKVLAKAKLGYCDGTSGVSTIPKAIRPAAWGAATCEYEVMNGAPRFYNIQSIGGEVPGEQTVPRAESWAATVLITRVHANAVARLGIAASYVTDGASKRTRLVKGKKRGHLVTVFRLSRFSHR